MSFVISPNMGLVIPGIGTEYSPNWAVDLNASLMSIDGHNHSPGQGVQITPNSININSNLQFNNQQAIGLSAVLFNNVASLATVNALYVVSGDLWYNDVTGAVQITSGGLVNATSSGISSGTATAAFSAGVLVVKSSSSSGANVLMQSAVLTNAGNLTNQLTLQAPTLAGSLALTLPAIPGATSFMQMDTSGNMSASIPLAGGITGSNIAAATITASNLDPSVTAAFSPSGAIVAFGGTAAPTGWLMCDGTSYLRATYTALFTAIGTAYGTADGTHFNVPDLRGQFIRGVSGASGNDPDASSRTANNSGGNTGNTVGSAQSYQIQSHTHSLPNVVTDSGATGLLNGDPGGIATSTGSTGGNETRPRNVYVNFIIKT